MEYLKKYWWAILLIVLVFGLWWYMSMKKKEELKAGTDTAKSGAKPITNAEANALKSQFSAKLAQRVADFVAQTGYYAKTAAGAESDETKKIKDRMAKGATAEQAILLDVAYEDDQWRKANNGTILDYTELYKLYSVPTGFYINV